MDDIRFYRDERDAQFTLEKLFTYVDLIKRAGLDEALFSRTGPEELVVYIPAATINAVKTAMHRMAPASVKEEAGAVVSCATSPKRPDPPPKYPQPGPEPEPDPPCKPGKAC